MPRFLIADDDPTYREWLRHHLDVLYSDAQIEGVSFTELLERADPVTQTDCDVLLVAACFGTSPEDPRAAGLALLRKLRGRENLPAIIAVAQEGNELTAVRAIHLGAADYLPKRLLTPERLGTSVPVALRRLQIQRLPEPPPPPRPEPEIEVRLDEPVSPPAAVPAPEPSPVPEPVEPRGRRTPSLPEPTAPEPLPVPADLIPGFTLDSRIGSSETASVYLALSERWGEVALKVSKTLRDEVAGRQFMEREYAAITQIRSPAVVTIHDYGVHGRHEYLVMEYLPRGNLKTRMQQGLSVDESLHYTHAIARALKVVHDAGVLHRDLKPPNVLLRDDDDVALIDFELARALDGSSGGTAGYLRGSPYYMSPEHALGELLDARSDFYSLGVIVHEMLTGRRPYTGTSALEVLQAHLNAPIPELPPELARYQDLLDRLLAKERQDRFANAAEIIAALAQLQAATLSDMEPSPA